MIETLKGLIAEHLHNISCHAPYTGRAGFTEPQAPVYSLGLNPGGAHDDPQYAERTIGASLAHFELELWNSYLDDSWAGRPPLAPDGK